MRLTAFKIRNFRSIVDSGWNSLSPDNITSLIGQNESGKTSVLEALHCFYHGNITDEMLRSDLSMPVIACEFAVEDMQLQRVFSKLKVSEIVTAEISQTKKIILTRSWQSNKISIIEIGGEKIENYYETIQHEIEEKENKLKLDFENIDSEGSLLESQIQSINAEILQTNDEINKTNQLLQDFTRQQQRAKTQEQREQLQTEIDNLQLVVEQHKNSLLQQNGTINELQNKLNGIADKLKYIRQNKQLKDNLSKLSGQAEGLKKQIKDLDESYFQISNIREKKSAEIKLNQLKDQYNQTISQIERIRKDILFTKTLAAHIISNQPYEEAKRLTIQDLSTPNTLATREEIGNLFFEFCPTFELFEDFSSLLPNKIDLDDLLNENIYAEGYKAARNFLIISGLDAKFFQQQNNRILKQMIEDLNGEITINFQDFWRQNVGKNNKIKIHFDLEHYDYTQPEKKGKPYIEFWIKDTRERLYPKQRSRGVRWFLSFYLELKATAIENRKNRILLIDEPGISLHARAQEDVLKVFEDIKDDLMIIYSTHSPHLIDVNKLYRLLAVQRAVEDDDTSETVIYDVRSLSKASSDTLSPIYSLMGSRFTEQQFINKYNNIVVEENSSHYLMQALFKLVAPSREVYILPATDLSNVTTLSNLLLGWKLDFIIVLSDTPKGNSVYNEIKNKLFFGNEQECEKKVVKLTQERQLIDYFSTIDFKNFILHQRVGITESNSEYIENNGLSANVMAMEFLNQVNEGKTKLTDFDEETQSNIQSLFNRILPILK